MLGKLVIVIALLTRVCQIDGYDQIDTYAGVQSNSGSTAGDGGPATSAKFNAPFFMWKDSAGVSYTGEDSGKRIRQINVAGIINPYFGTGVATVSGNGGAATSASGSPWTIWSDAAGNVFFADNSGSVLRKIGTNKIVNAFAGGGALTTENAAATQASFSGIYTAFGDTAGNIYAFCQGQYKIKKISTSLLVTTLAGTGSGASTDSSTAAGLGGQATAVRFYQPRGGFLDSNNVIYVSSNGGGFIRALPLSTGIVTLKAGVPGAQGYAGDFYSATNALLQSGTTNVAGDSSGKLYYSSLSYNNVRYIDTAGIIAPYAGKAGLSTTGGYSGDGGAATAALMKGVYGMSCNNGDKVLIAELSNNVFRSVTVAAGSVTSTYPDGAVTVTPTLTPTKTPTVSPTTRTPTVTPTLSIAPTIGGSTAPTVSPTVPPTVAPTVSPSVIPTLAPTEIPSLVPTAEPTLTMPPTESPTTAAPSMTPSVMPSVQPSVVPTMVPTVAPSVVPTAAPSVQPSVKPTVKPSVVPTIVPTAAPSVVPTLTPTVIPTVVPTAMPTAVPTVVPSALPTVTPTAPTVTPTQAPSVRPTRSPTAAPTEDSVDITFDTNIYLHNVTATVLDATDQSSVTGAVAETLDIDSDRVTFLRQEFIGSEGERRLRRLTVAVPSYQIMVAVNVWASTRDFEDATNQNASYLYHKLKSTLVSAVDTNEFSMTVRSVAAQLNAVNTLYVGRVNLTVTDYSVVTSDVSAHHNNSLSTGALAGMIVGIVVGSLLVIIGCYFLVMCALKHKHKQEKVVATIDQQKP